MRFSSLRLVCVAAFVLASPFPSIQAQDTLSVDLAGAIGRALDGSPEVGIETAGRDYAAARLQQARAARFATEFTATSGHAVAPGLDRAGSALPENALYLDPSVRNDWENVRPYNQIEFELLQPLYTWGELGGTIRAAEAGVAVEEAVVSETREAVALRTAELVVGLQLTDALGRLADETRSVLGRARSELQTLLDEGDPDVDDASLFQLRLFEQETAAQVAELEQNRLLALSGLARQLLVPGALVLPAAPLAPLSPPADSLATYQALALEHRSEVRQATAGIRAREALVEVAQSDYYPKLFVGLSGGARYSEGRPNQANPFISDGFSSGSGVRAGFGLRQNLAFGQTKARVEQARAQAEEVRYQATAAEQLVLFEVEEAYRRMRIREAALQARTEARRLAGEWERLEQVNYDLGLGSTTGLTGATRARLEADAAYSDAVRAYNVAVLRLYAATGTLADRAERHLERGTSFEEE
jgi:outer membrane protein TolC